MFHHILGMHTVSDSVFFGTLKEMYDHVKDILDGICLEARKEMQDMDQEKIGSWQRAVTCGDAVWLTRGSFSRNCTYTVRNYLIGALLYYCHICQKGSDNLCQDDIYEGTSKAAEGFGANEVFKLMVKDQMNVECHIQDGDSTSENVVLKHFPLCRVLRCGNHVAKNHAIKLDKLRKLKEMTTNDGVRVECYCKGKKHAKHCGCLTEKFIRKAKASFQMCLTNAGTDPNAFSEKLMNLALHHFQDEHQWDGGQCDFHPLVVCSCGSCTDKYNLKCHGKPYKSDQVLKCPFHTLAYKLECQEKAGLADVLIHPEIGKVTTNPVEASHNVLVRYRSKNWNLARLHYHVSTNIGLIQGCMTYLFTKRGPQYHWILDILKRMCLPVVQNLPSILEKLNADRFFDIESKKTNVAKARRKLYKRKRKVFEHQRRQLFVKESAMNHDYGRDASTEEVIADASTDKCKCGSTDHRRTSHKICPLRRTCDTATGIDTSCDINASKSDDNVSEYDDDCYDFECSLKTKSFHSLESDCLIDEEKTNGASKVLHEMLPPPSTNRDWVQKAVAIISKLSGIAVVERVDAVKQVPCREIAPHIRDEIVGDGACFYRTISEAITGTEDNHFAVRMSLINFMLDPANVLAFGRLVRAGIYYDIDALKAVRSHINRHKLYLETSWSTEYEVFAAATMFQVKIMVFSEYSNYRDWHTYVPRFTNETCMTPMKVMLYLYHINRNHYDLVIPVLD
uniref:OTU domain-containing protein n=1 Tax=Amphimedon queenslandica TaxID=400682 RepID=A0A1X7SXU9_AMPQE